MAGVRVLIVDDERALLPLLERYLRKLGYAPACFHEPEPAIEAFRAAALDNSARFQLVMTDLTLPRVSGEELAKVVLAEDAAVCVVVMSGYPYSTQNFSGPERERVTFLQKPFMATQFQEAVARFAVAQAAEEAPVPLAEPALPAPDGIDAGVPAHGDEGGPMPEPIRQSPALLEPGAGVPVVAGRPVAEPVPELPSREQQSPEQHMPEGRTPELHIPEQHMPDRTTLDQPLNPCLPDEPTTGLPAPVET